MTTVFQLGYTAAPNIERVFGSVTDEISLHGLHITYAQQQPAYSATRTGVRNVRPAGRIRPVISFGLALSRQPQAGLEIQ